MNRGCCVVISTLEALALLLAVYFEPSHGVRGTLWGEAFFEGKPTSWWRRELADWKVQQSSPYAFPRVKYAKAYRESWSDWVNRHRLKSTQGIVVVPIAATLLSEGPPLIYGGESAAPVLRELLDDPSPEI